MVMMGTIKPSKYQDLVAGDSKVDSKSKKKLKIHLSKRETSQSLKRSPQAPRTTPRRRRIKEKLASAHTAVRAIILRALI